MSNHIRVLIADNQDIFRVGIQSILERERDIEVVGAVQTTPEVLPQVRDKNPNVVLLGLKWCHDDHAVHDVIAQLRLEFPRTCIIVLVVPDDHLIQEAQAAGAEWVRTKEVSKSNLLHSIRDAYTSLYRRMNPTIGIITALPKEYVAVKMLLENQSKYRVPGRGAGRRYLLGEIPADGSGKHSLVLSLADMGNNIAANRATLLLEHFPTVESIIMVGIAGGIPCPDVPDEHIRLGDVVVSNQKGVVQYDFDKETITETIHRHPPRPPSATLLEGVRWFQVAVMEGNHSWLKFIDQITEQLGITRPPEETDVLIDSTNTELVIPHPQDPKRVCGQPRIFLGPIASANKLLKNPIKRDELRQRFGTKAVEMEGSGIADATWNHEVGYLVVRGICDYCDSNKRDDWQEYAASIAAAYTRALLESIPAQS